MRPGARTITAATVISVSAAAAANGLFGLVPAAGASPRPVSANLTASVHSLAPAAPVPGPARVLPAAAPRIESALLAVLRLDLAALRGCESSGDYGIDTGNGYYGAYQFDLPTWESLGYQGLPSDASPAIQDNAAMRLEQQRGWEP
ncbi:MAG: transglycosylase family protein, partial [Mycobacteriales bacterium]